MTSRVPLLLIPPAMSRTMPQDHPGLLTPQQASDVSAYVHSMPRPKFNEAYKNLNALLACIGP